MRTDWLECFKFSFIRNPWDRAVSLFFNQKRESSDSDDFKKWLIEMIEEHGHPSQKTTEWELTDRLDSTGGTSTPWKAQTDWLVDFDNNLCMDFIGRFENIYEDIEVIENILGNNLILPHIRKTDHQPYQEYYKDQESKDIVADWHKKDIDNFGYSF